MSALFNLAHFFASHPLTRNSPHKAWWRFLSWQIKSRMQSEVIIPWVGGQCLAVQKGMTGATGNIYAGLHEFVDMMLCLHCLREGDLFFDIGANVGSYTVLASGVCRAYTWAFEPDPDTVRHLRRNIAINCLNGLATVYELALGATDTEIAFTVGLDTINRVVSTGDRTSQMVKQQRLDGLLGDQQPLMIKMDVEGYEEEVLCGAEALLTRNSLKVVQLETVSPVANEMLIRNQFARAYYEPYTRKLQSEPTARSSSNSLFVRDWEFVRSRLSTAKPIEVLGQVV